jgi:hypothetical protein
MVGVANPVRGAGLIEHQVASLRLQVMRTLIVGECPLRVQSGSRKGERQDQGKAATVRHVERSSFEVPLVWKSGSPVLSTFATKLERQVRFNARSFREFGNTKKYT